MKKTDERVKEVGPFLRANFFSGLVATPKFWNEIQEYLFGKENLYNRLFHGVGVVPGVLGQFAVKPISGTGSNLAVVIDSGVALDGNGRGIFLYEPQALTIDHRKFKLPCTVYFSAKYKEVMEDYYQNEENPDYQGYRKRLETAALEVTRVCPDNHESLELARVTIREDANGQVVPIREASGFSEPGEDAIDPRFVPWVVVAKQGLSPYFKEYFVDVLERTRTVAQMAHDALALNGFRELQVMAMTSKMLVQCGDIRMENVVHIMHPLFDVDNQILQEILEYERLENKHLYSTKESFGAVKTAVFEMGDYIKAFDGGYGTLDEIVRRQQTFLAGVGSMFVAKQMTLADLAIVSYEPPRILMLGNERYTVVDVIDLRDEASVENHSLRFSGNRDVSTSSVSLVYPDGELVRDTVKHYVGGSVSFMLRNIIKRRKLVLLRRTDIGAGGYTITVRLDQNSRDRILSIDAPDSRARWRNCVIEFGEEEILRNDPTVEFSIGESGRDNFGKIWVYQSL